MSPGHHPAPLSARSVRDVLAEVGLPVMDPEILLAQMYAGRSAPRRLKSNTMLT
jgi:hypothetical protein